VRQAEPISYCQKDPPTARAAARAKASQIEPDIYSENFDATLLKYKPRILGKPGIEVTAPELFDRFIQHKLKNEGVSSRSIETRYKPLLRYLQRSLNLPAQEGTQSKARGFKALLMEKLPLKGQKRGCGYSSPAETELRVSSSCSR
jgi:integrase